MSLKYVLLAQASLTGTATPIYAAPSATQAAIHAASATNPTGAPVTVNLYLTASGGSPSISNRIASRVVGAGATVTLHDAINHKIPASGILSSDGNGCAITVGGVEYIPGT